MQQKVTITINAPLILKMRDIIIKCEIRDGEIVCMERLRREDVKRLFSV
jgi:hypothetical protein